MDGCTIKRRRIQVGKDCQTEGGPSAPATGVGVSTERSSWSKQGVTQPHCSIKSACDADRCRVSAVSRTSQVQQQASIQPQPRTSVGRYERRAMNGLPNCEGQGGAGIGRLSGVHGRNSGAAKRQVLPRTRHNMHQVSARVWCVPGPPASCSELETRGTPTCLGGALKRDHNFGIHCHQRVMRMAAQRAALVCSTVRCSR